MTSPQYDNLIRLIEQIPELKECFKTVNHSIGRAPGGRYITTNIRTIRNNDRFMEWRAELEYELDLLPQNSTVSEIQRLLKHIDSGWTEENDFNIITKKLKVLQKHIQNQTESPLNQTLDPLAESELCNNVLKALISIQKNPIYRGRNEDEINDGIRDILNIIYNGHDQTRQGVSESKIDAGEIDFLIKTPQGLPYAIMEALKLSYLDKNELNNHINKALVNYDPTGCPYVFVFLYVTAVNFDDFWRKFITYMKEYQFQYEVKNHIYEIDHHLAESKHAKAILSRNNCDISVHFYAIHIAS